tara:strand:+ start:729 stop:896 length:168 start_codon:yes stop_codon:yes gene_type:complete
LGEGIQTLAARDVVGTLVAITGTSVADPDWEHPSKRAAAMTRNVDSDGNDGLAQL